MRFPGIFLAGVATFFGVGLACAQSPSPSAAPVAKTEIINGAFEKSSIRDDLWLGVDRQGYLAGEKNSSLVLTLGGGLGSGPMPVSAGVSDMNADGLLDIVAVDPVGYLRLYFNHGSKEEPQFPMGNMSFPVFTVSPNQHERIQQASPRLALADLGSGRKDLIVGNYEGDIFIIKNTGSTSEPAFKQPADFAKEILNTRKDPKHRWGNVFAPVLVDWDKDGKLDLLLGEGSYSANNVHLFLNQGSTAVPRYTEEKHYILAYGDGREQLNVAVVDYNGDGKDDLLVTDRSGQIGVYMNRSGTAWKPGDELPLDSFIKAGTATTPMTFGGVCSIATGDLNGDGLFDLIVGKANGRIAYVKNSGTKEAPKFDAPVELKGKEPSKPMRLPVGWDVNYGLDRGNLFGRVDVVKAEEDKTLELPEGTAALRVGYSNPPPGAPVAVFPGPAGVDLNTNTVQFHNSGGGTGTIITSLPSNMYTLMQSGRLQFKIGSTYTLSFRTKGNKARSCMVQVVYNGFKNLSEAKVTRSDRGGATVALNQANETPIERIKFSPTPAWAEVKKDFTVKLSDKDLRDLKVTTIAAISIFIELEPGVGEVYLDDLKITEKK